MSDTSTNAANDAAVLHLWQFDSAWVIAATEADARWLLDDGRTARLIRQVPDEEPFTMYYEDEVPSDLEDDNKCECDPADVEKFGCECEAAQPQVTLTAGEWCARKSQDRVIYEFQS